MNAIGNYIKHALLTYLLITSSVDTRITYSINPGARIPPMHAYEASPLQNSMLQKV